MFHLKDIDWLNEYKNKTHIRDPYNKTQCIYIYTVYKRLHFTPSDTYRLKVRVWKKAFHAKGN